MKFVISSSGNMKKEVIKHIENLPEGMYEVTISKKSKGRSLNQNGYYWAVIINPLAEWLGWDDPDELHEFLKEKFGFREERLIEKTGEVVLVPKSTKEYTTIEMEKYHEKIRIWAARDLIYTIPLPNEQHAIDYYNQQIKNESRKPNEYSDLNRLSRQGV